MNSFQVCIIIDKGFVITSKITHSFIENIYYINM